MKKKKPPAFLLTTVMPRARDEVINSRYRALLARDFSSPRVAQNPQRTRERTEREYAIEFP